MEKALSIIIPAYNVSQYIDQGIESLISNQSIVSNLDIIIVNDGSKDDTLQKALQYAKNFPNVVTVINKQNGGHGSGINVGIKVAKGRYLKVLDGDDWVKEEGIVELVKYILNEKGEEPDIIVNPFEKVWENGQRRRIDYSSIQPRTMVSYKEVNENNYTLPLHSLTLRTGIYRVNIMPDIDEKISYDDMEYILFPVPYINKIVFLQKTLYQYRLGLQNQSMNPSQMMKKIPMHTKVIDTLCRYYNDYKHNFNDEQKRYFLQELVDTIATNYILSIKTGMSNAESEVFFVKYGYLPLKKSRNRKFIFVQEHKMLGNFIIRHVIK